MSTDAPSARQSTGWLSYDSVAAIYQQVAEPWFSAMARDLVAAVSPGPGASVLDIGTGTGLCARLACAAVGAAGRVVGIDPSTGMLERARRAGGVDAVAGMAPGLPFRESTFDVATANLVLSHIHDLDGGLGDIVATIRPGGRLGATAWAPMTRTDAVRDEQAEADALVGDVTRSLGLDTTSPFPGAPCEEQLRDRDFFSASLERAGLAHVVVEAHSYEWTFRVDDFVAGWNGLARYLRASFGLDRWKQLHDEAARVLHDRFGATILSVRRVWIATGSTE